MPRWARFLSCSFTGLLLSLAGVVLIAYWWEGGSTYWRALIDFIPTVGFWYLAALFGLLSMLTVLAARVLVRSYDLEGSAAGLFAGAVIGAAYAAFLVATHAADWGGMSVSLQKTWRAGLLFMVPWAATGALTAWLWERLD